MLENPCADLDPTKLPFLASDASIARYNQVLNHYKAEVRSIGVAQIISNYLARQPPGPRRLLTPNSGRAEVFAAYVSQKSLDVDMLDSIAVISAVRSVDQPLSDNDISFIVSMLKELIVYDLAWLAEQLGKGQYYFSIRALLRVAIMPRLCLDFYRQGRLTEEFFLEMVGMYAAVMEEKLQLEYIKVSTIGDIPNLHYVLTLWEKLVEYFPQPECLLLHHVIMLLREDLFLQTQDEHLFTQTALSLQQFKQNIRRPNDTDKYHFELAPIFTFLLEEAKYYTVINELLQKRLSIPDIDLDDAIEFSDAFSAAILSTESDLLARKPSRLLAERKFFKAIPDKLALIGLFYYAVQKHRASKDYILKDVTLEIADQTANEFANAWNTGNELSVATSGIEGRAVETMTSLLYRIRVYMREPSMATTFEPIYVHFLYDLRGYVPFGKLSTMLFEAATLYDFANYSSEIHDFLQQAWQFFAKNFMKIMPPRTDDGQSILIFNMDFAFYCLTFSKMLNTQSDDKIKNIIMKGITALAGALCKKEDFEWLEWLFEYFLRMIKSKREQSADQRDFLQVTLLIYPKIASVLILPQIVANILLTEVDIFLKALQVKNEFGLQNKIIFQIIAIIEGMKIGSGNANTISLLEQQLIDHLNQCNSVEHITHLLKPMLMHIREHKPHSRFKAIISNKVASLDKSLKTKASTNTDKPSALGVAVTGFVSPPKNYQKNYMAFPFNLKQETINRILLNYSGDDSQHLRLPLYKAAIITPSNAERHLREKLCEVIDGRWMLKSTIVEAAYHHAYAYKGKKDLILNWSNFTTLFNAGISSSFEKYIDNLTDDYLRKGVVLADIPDYQRDVIALILCLFEGINSEGGAKVKSVIGRLNARPGPLRKNELDWKCKIAFYFGELSENYKKGTKPSSVEQDPKKEDDRVAESSSDAGSSRPESVLLIPKVVKPRPIKVNPASEVITAPAPVKEPIKVNRTLTLDDLSPMRDNAQRAIVQFQRIGAQFTLLTQTTRIEDRASRYDFIQRFKHLLTKLWEAQELLRNNLTSDSDILTRFFQGDSLTCLRHWRIHAHDHLLKYLDNKEYVQQLLQWSSFLTMLSKISSTQIEIKKSRFNLLPQADFDDYFPINLFSADGSLVSNLECKVPESILALVDAARKNLSTTFSYEDAAAVLQTDVPLHVQFLAKLMVQYHQATSADEQIALLDIIGASVGDIGEIIKHSYLKEDPRFLPLMKWRNVDAHLSVDTHSLDWVGQLQRAITACETLQEVLADADSSARFRISNF